MVDGVPPPQLTLSASAPLVARGTGFAAGDRIAVRLAVGRVVRLVRDGNGMFRARFSALVAIDPCHGRIVVTATGSTGTLARASRACRTPPPTPA
jgi:hypothetical protein